VGDLIKLKVTAQNLSEDQLIEKFSDFEIVDIRNDNNGYIVTLRSFETGEKTLQLGNKEIIVTVKSTLDEIEREGIFEGGSNIEKAGFFVDWRYPFYVLLAVFLISGAILLWRLLLKKRISSMAPYRYFVSRVKKIPMGDDKLFVKLTQAFKRYIESSYSLRIRGKTSTEIINEISFVHDLQDKLPQIQIWLEESDYYKFSGVAASEVEKQRLSRDVLELTEKIENAKEEGVKV
jgi:hypothetical protein